MKLWQVVQLYDVGSSHPEVHTTLFTTKETALEYINEQGGDENEGASPSDPVKGGGYENEWPTEEGGYYRLDELEIDNELIPFRCQKCGCDNCGEVGDFNQRTDLPGVKGTDGTYRSRWICDKCNTALT